MARSLFPRLPQLPSPVAVLETRVVRLCRVPDDFAAVTDRGPEAGSDAAVEAVWSRAEGMYRSGIHPGIQLCVRHRGEVVLDRSIGHARGVRPGVGPHHDAARPLTVGTPINLFSAGKAVTALTLHKLEEQGLLDLDDPVHRHVPGFARHGKESITLRQVLTHRAGIPAWPRAHFDLDLIADDERLEEAVCDLRPVGPPGGAPAYHALSGGFVLEVVARRSLGRSLREVLRTEIKEPLGLSWLDFGVEPDHAGHVAHNVITGLPFLPPLTRLVERALGIDWDQAVRLSNDPRFVSGVIPSGNVVVTARDVAALYDCLLQGGELDGVRILAPDTVARALAPDRPGLDFDRRIGVPMQYSAGFMLGTPTFSLYGWNHPRAFGHVGLANSFTWADPDRDLVVALLTTGKAAIGPHIPALAQLITEIHRTFPPHG